MNLTEIPTPRVDSEIRDMGTDGDGDASYLHVSFCRQLERESAAWRAVAESLAEEFRDLAWLAGPANDPSPSKAEQAIQTFDALKAQLTQP